MRLHRRLSGAALSMLAGLTLAPTNALAWGPEGHSVILEAAYARLQAKNSMLADKFDAILKGGKGLKYPYVNPKTKKNESCAASTRSALANWPDCVRYSTTYAYTAPYHFDDIPLCVDAPPLPPLATFCDSKAQCGTRVLDSYLQKLQAPGTSARERAIALAFIVHIVGDLHQPMHAIENGRDNGGNSVKLAVDKAALPLTNPNYPPDNLHSLWDTPLVKEAVGTDVDQAARDVGTLAEAHKSAWTSSDPNDWVIRAHGIGQQAYRQLPQTPACGVSYFEAGMISPAYVATFKPQVKEQLARASLDLAAYLETALAGAP